MKATLCPEPVVPNAVVLQPRPAAAAVSRAADYLALTKPRVAVLVLFTVAAGALLAGVPGVSIAIVLHAVFGTALVAAGASALNQWLERHRDANMRRTASRPLPAGRLQPYEAFLFGVALGAVGVCYLALALPSPWAALLAAFTFATYVGVYTPLKPLTTLNTLVGAVPGAMPPVIGWCAARGAVTEEAGALFVILFLWQVPHFLAIAWIYRDEYARAGHLMLPVVDRRGTLTARHMVTWCLALIPASLGPVLLGKAGLLYLVGAVLLGLFFLGTALRFRRQHGVAQARRVLRASLLYLPGLLALLLLDRVLPSVVLPR
jgi:protoheme IX farnesyltransferase